MGDTIVMFSMSSLIVLHQVFLHLDGGANRSQYGLGIGALERE